MNFIIITTAGLLLIASCCNSYEKRGASDYLVVSDVASIDDANEAIASHSKVVTFHPRSFRSAIIGGSHMQNTAGAYSAGEILFITYKFYDSDREDTYEFIKDGKIVHTESADFLSGYTIQELVTEYLG